MSGPLGQRRSGAVLIGTSHYSHDELTPIPAAAANVADLADVLTAPGCAFTTEYCETIHEPKHPSEVGDAVGRVARAATDTLLVYYAGHGIIDRRGRLHLAVSGSDPAPGRIRWTSVPFELLREEILESPARVRILILDCCFAGLAFEAMSDVPSLVDGQTDIRGTYTITSCAANETSFAPSGLRNTAFTAALLSAITPGITLDDLYQETDRTLQRNGFPRPRRRSVDIAGELRLFGAPRDEQTSQDPADITPPAIPTSPIPKPAEPHRITRRRLLVGGAAVAPLAAGAIWGLTRLSTPSSTPVHPSCIATLDGPNVAITELAFSPDSSQLAGTYSDRSVALWNVSIEPFESTGLSVQTSTVKSLAFSPDPSAPLLAVASFDTVELWNTRSRPPRKEDPLTITGYYGVRYSPPLVRLAFNQDGSLLANFNDHGEVQLWDMHTRQATSTPLTFSDDGFDLCAMAFDHQDDTLLVIPNGISDPAVEQWNVSTRPPRAAPLAIPGATFSRGATAFSGDGAFLAAGFDDTLQVWDIGTRQPIGPPLAHPTAEVHSLAFNPHNQVLAAGNADNTIQLWSLRTTPPEVITLHGHTAPVWSVAFSPDLRLLASGSEDKTVRLWDTSKFGLFAI